MTSAEPFHLALIADVIIVSLSRLTLAICLLLGLAGGFAAAASAAPSAPPAETAISSRDIQVAQMQPAQAPATPTSNDIAAADLEPIGNVAAQTGTVTVIRNKASQPLKLRDDIFLNDIVQTSAASTLGITFNDGTTFHLTANAKITIDSYIYEDGGKQNSAVFNVGGGIVAFVAAAVAKTGDMKIDTPTATLGIRGTTGLIEVPATASAATNNVAIKLYPDPDGRVGRIEVNDRAGARLGALTQGASGFSIRGGSGGARFSAVPLVIAAREVQRDQGFVRQVHTAQTVGRQIVTEQRAFRRANPGSTNPNRGNVPGQGRPNVAPGQNQRGQPQQQPGVQPPRPTQPGRQGAQPTPQPRPGTVAQPAQNGQLNPAQTKPNQTKPNQVPLNQIRPNQAQPNGVQQAAPRLQRPGLVVRPVPKGRPVAPSRGRRGDKPPR